MTIIEAINRVDALKPNNYTQHDKVGWLSEIDGLIKLNIIDKYEGGRDIIFSGYDDAAMLDTMLLVSAPYEDIYEYWLESKIDYNNGEMNKYNNSVTRFNDSYSNYQRNYNSSHVHLQTEIKYF